MSLDAVAELVAEQITRQKFIEVYAHHDADGIATASILCHAMIRRGIRFRLRIRQELTLADLAGEDICLLCDLGAGKEDLPRGTLVVDHHLPRFDGDYHVNPRLANIDGDRELSASGTAYLVAQKMGDNRDLAGLVMPGIIGDGQTLTGKNLEIFNDAVANGIIMPDRGLTLPGRDMPERWYMAISPYLEGISGEEPVIADLIDQAKGDNSTRLDILLSLALLTAAPSAPFTRLQDIYGDTYRLEREVIENAHALTAVIDACGKSGRGDLGAALCMRSSHDLVPAWEIACQHRMKVIEAVRATHPFKGSGGICEVQDTAIVSDVANVLAHDRLRTTPVLVYARAHDSCRISVRCPAATIADLGSLVRELAITCGGSGGGHHRSAGATIPCDRIGIFTKGWQEALAA